MHSPLFLKIESLVHEQNIKSILMNGDSEITQEALNAWYEKFTRPEEILAEEKKVIDESASGTSSQYSWPTIKWIWARHFRQKLLSFTNEPPLAVKSSSEENDVLLRVLPQMFQLELSPFSFQRMAELVRIEDNTYKSVDRWLFAIQRGLNVTSDFCGVVKPENADVENLEKIMQILSAKVRTLLSEKEYEPSASIVSEESNDEDVGSSGDRNRKRKIPSGDVSPEKKQESPPKGKYPDVDIVASAIADLVDESDFDTGMKIKKPRTEGRHSYEEVTATKSTTSKFVNILKQAGVSMEMLNASDGTSAGSKEEHVQHVYVHENEEEDSLFGGVLVSPTKEKEESASLLSDSPDNA